MEYMSGSVAGSKNIPLNEIPNRLDEFKSMQQPLVVFCRSGARSEQARGYLAAQGFEVFNGGPWTNVNNMLAELK
jgi:rhodanese-related sulfurtransferase